MYSGVKNEPDFEIFLMERTGAKNLFVFHGIENPVLTASLSVAHEIADNIEKG